MKRVSIVLPTCNEKDNLKKFVMAVLAQQKKLPNHKMDIIISDSRSKDGTIKIAKHLSKRYRNVHFLETGPGIGVGLHNGHTYALKHFRPNILMQLDADGQVNESIIPALVKIIENGNNLAIGSRFIKGGKNELPLSRKIFSYGSSLICRLVMGPWGIQEFTNSARAFTPELFNKINWKRLPWREKTFIMLPAFINEAVLAGAKYKEAPLVFRFRAEGFSKNKIIKYTYDLLTYVIDARLHKWGFNVPFFSLSRKKT